MIRKLAIAVGGALGALVLCFVVLMAASELQEVVILHSQDEDGAWYETRLWTVDYGGTPWLRAGSRNRAWLERVSASTEVRMERDGRLAEYTAKVIPILATSTQIDRLMLAKYGWTDAVFRWLEGSPRTIPVRLHPR